MDPQNETNTDANHGTVRCSRNTRRSSSSIDNSHSDTHLPQRQSRNSNNPIIKLNQLDMVELLTLMPSIIKRV